MDEEPLYGQPEAIERRDGCSCAARTGHCDADSARSQSEKEQELSESNSADTSAEQNMIKIARAEAKLKELEAIRDAKDAGILSKILYPLASILSGNRDKASPERIKGAQNRLNELKA